MRTEVARRPRRDAQARRLKVLILRGCGLTQQEAAKRLGISTRTVQRLERGRAPVDLAAMLGETETVR